MRQGKFNLFLWQDKPLTILPFPEDNEYETLGLFDTWPKGLEEPNLNTVHKKEADNEKIEEHMKKFKEINQLL